MTGEWAEDITNKKFNCLLAIKLDYKWNRRHYWVFLCDCGKQKTIVKSSVVAKRTKSCGCALKNVMVTHGGSKKTEYRIWVKMKSRCLNKKNDSYYLYGGRGIGVCKRWIESFDNFYSDMGPRPSMKHSLDRINNHGNYEPSNCRWATQSEQMRNTRRNRLITVDGEKMCLAEVCKLTGIGYSTLSARVSYGWTDERIVKTPILIDRKKNGTIT